MKTYFLYQELLKKFNSMRNLLKEENEDIFEQKQCEILRPSLLIDGAKRQN